ncbi:MAG: basic secretory protein-like protein [Planctomycetota bacterium]
MRKARNGERGVLGREQFTIRPADLGCVQTMNSLYAKTRLVCAAAICMIACASIPPGAGLPTTSETLGDLTIQIQVEPDASLDSAIAGLKKLYFMCYPQLLKRFENPNKPASRTVTLVLIPDYPWPAASSGNRIMINLTALRRAPTDIGYLVHELAHVVQAYPVYEPGWLTEGIADVARAQYTPHSDPFWSMPQKMQPDWSYQSGYGIAASFLTWLETRHTGIVDVLHRKMQNGHFKIELFAELTGKDADALWSECVSELGK